ncbi:MAG: hypothetical protein ACI4SF_16110 [Oscillospiraceae bacterium]
MKKFETVTEYEILQAAWEHYLAKWSSEVEKSENAAKILGHNSDILDKRVKHYKEISDELHDVLVELENQRS